MKHVSPPNIDDAHTLDQIIAAKRPLRRNLLRSIQPQVVIAYENYTDTAPGLESLSVIQIEKEKAEALRHAYTVNTAPMSEQRLMLMKPLDVTHCPYCNVGESSTLDHYVPKELYPEFAVLSKNLVPCCSSCNTRKGERFVSEDANIRLLLHPYYDVIPEEAVLSLDARIVDSSMILNYRISQPPNIDEELLGKLRTHFEILDLANRYRINALVYLREQRHSLHRLYGDEEDGDRVSRELIQYAEDCESEYGFNHWRAVLCRELALYSEFCDGGFVVLDGIQ
jgi:hypothetical protein